MMGYCTLLAVSLWTLAVSVQCFGHRHDAFLTVDTTSGAVHGFINDTAPAVRQFLGIPYAEPPLGSLRFAPPRPKTAHGPIDATHFGNSCMQQFSTNPTIYTEEVPQFLINGGQSEDCLFAHIWAPLQTKKPLPVFVYIPGGGFVSGGANSLYKIPDKWIQKTQSHIVVVIK
jgi:carboxylesterase type B